MSKAAQSSTDALAIIVTREIERLGSDPAASEFGADWWQVSREEAAVFDLDPNFAPALATYWSAYEAILGLTSGGFDTALSDSLRSAFLQDHPQIAKHAGGSGRPAATDVHTFMSFAAMFGCPNRHAYAWFHKQQMSLLRGGVVVFEDEGLVR